MVLGSTTDQRGCRAARPGTRAGRVLAAAFVLACAGGAVGCSAQAAPAGAAHAARHASSGGKYGKLPGWLPKPTVQVGRVVQASAAHPRLGIEGDTIVVHVGSARVTVTTVGPQVPEEGRFPVPATSPCAFDVTLTRATAPIALRHADFTVLDELGHLHVLRITARSGGPAPTVIRPGQTATLVMRAVLPTGSGTLRWSPDAPRPVASWDFDVEID
jgi:hypothetical protein